MSESKADEDRENRAAMWAQIVKNTDAGCKALGMAEGLLVHVKAQAERIEALEAKVDKLERAPHLREPVRFGDGTIYAGVPVVADGGDSKACVFCGQATEDGGWCPHCRTVYR